MMHMTITVRFVGRLSPGAVWTRPPAFETVRPPRAHATGAAAGRLPRDPFS